MQLEAILLTILMDLERSPNHESGGQQGITVILSERSERRIPGSARVRSRAGFGEVLRRLACGGLRMTAVVEETLWTITSTKCGGRPPGGPSSAEIA